MSKRRLSSPPLPPAKRLHGCEDDSDTRQDLNETAHLALSSLLYDELILYIFSHLSWVDLCAVQATSRNWSRLATDNGLWRNLYLMTFGRPRLRGGRGFVGQSNYGRDVKPLPARSDGDEVKDWKWMFRISSNWRKGRCSVERLHSSALEAAQAIDQMHVVLAGPLVLSASSRPCSSPWICLSGVGDLCHKLHCPTNGPGLHHIVALAQDQSCQTSENAKVAAFLHNGSFSIFHINYSNPALSYLQTTHISTRRSWRPSNISQAVFHHPILITLSNTFSLSIYDLSSGSIRHSQTLASYTSYPPTSLVLSAPTPETYKLVLTYSVPVYPHHWSIGVTELVISSSRASTSTLSSHRLVAPPMSVVSTRTIRAVDIPQGWMDENKLRAMQEQWSRKVFQVADTQSDGKWVILAPEDPASPAMIPPDPSLAINLGMPKIYSPVSMQLYRLSLPSVSPSISASRPKLSFVRNLQGQAAPISMLAVADGRCVSLGTDGSIWVWDLENGASTEVHSLDSKTAGAADSSRLIKGTVTFDERRIVTARGNDIIIRRFDV